MTLLDWTEEPGWLFGTILRRGRHTIFCGPNYFVAWYNPPDGPSQRLGQVDSKAEAMRVAGLHFLELIKEGDQETPEHLSA